MKTKTMIIGLTGLIFGILGYAGKNLNMPGSNELLLLGALVIIFGFLLPVTLKANEGNKSGDLHTINWLGFVGLAAILMGIILVVLKYFIPAILLLALGSISAGINFALMSHRLSNRA